MSTNIEPCPSEIPKTTYQILVYKDGTQELLWWFESLENTPYHMKNEIWGNLLYKKGIYTKPNEFMCRKFDETHRIAEFDFLQPTAESVKKFLANAELERLSFDYMFFFATFREDVGKALENFLGKEAEEQPFPFDDEDCYHEPFVTVHRVENIDIHCFIRYIGGAWFLYFTPFCDALQE